MKVSVLPDSEVDTETVPACEVTFETTFGYVWAPPCSNPAVWWGITLCCGGRGLWCNSCKERADGHGDFKSLLDICGECGGRGMKWVKL